MQATTRLMAAAAAALLVSAPGDVGAWSLFGSAKRDLFDKAGAQAASAEAAHAEGRVLDEYDALMFAVRDCNRLASEFPDYRTEEVGALAATVRARLAELSEGIRNGTIAVPDPDEVLSGSAAARTLAAGEIPPVKEAPSADVAPGAGGGDRYPTPPLVSTKPAEEPSADPSSAPSETPPEDPEKLARLDAPIPNPFYVPHTDEENEDAENEESEESEESKDKEASERVTPAPEPEPQPAPAPASAHEPAPAPKPAPAPEPPAPVPTPAQTQAPEPTPAPETPAPAPAPAPEPTPAPETPAPTPAPTPTPAPEPPAPTPAQTPAAATREDVAPKLRALAAMIKSGQASEAVILLEDVLEVEPEGPNAVAARVLLARALMECRNAQRAAAELSALPESANSDPAVRSLRAATAISQGRFPEAILQLHLLVSENPAWADAWTDLAWAYFLMDPEANRISSISYYRNALTRGARRDQELERRLRVKIGAESTAQRPAEKQ